MVVPIPDDFDVNKLELDSFETYIRDELHVSLSSWAKFRHTIMIGNNAHYLHPDPGPISEEVKEAYRELAKSHYEVVKSLGCAKLAFNTAQRTQPPVHLIYFEKAVKDCYFHLGRVLDNLARLIYIVNVPSAPTEKMPRKRKQLMRHWIDWGGTAKLNILGYTRLSKSKQLKSILNVRNVLTHGWSIPIEIKVSSEIVFYYCWPQAVCSRRDFYWFYDERNKLERTYKNWIPILDMIDRDYQFIECFQNKVFDKLTRDVSRRFERNHKLVIRSEVFTIT